MAENCLQTTSNRVKVTTKTSKILSQNKTTFSIEFQLATNLVLYAYTKWERIENLEVKIRIPIKASIDDVKYHIADHFSAIDRTTKCPTMPDMEIYSLDEGENWIFKNDHDEIGDLTNIMVVIKEKKNLSLQFK